MPPLPSPTLHTGPDTVRPAADPSIDNPPHTDGRTGGGRYEMVVAKAAVAPGAEPQELVGVDIKGNIRPALAQIKAIIIDKVHEARCVRPPCLLVCLFVLFGRLVGAPFPRLRL